MGYSTDPSAIGWSITRESTGPNYFGCFIKAPHLSFLRDRWKTGQARRTPVGMPAEQKCARWLPSASLSERPEAVPGAQDGHTLEKSQTSREEHAWPEEQIKT